MKNYKDIKESFVNLVEKRVNPKASMAEELLTLLKYLDNDHYAHFTKENTAHGSVGEASSAYLSTPKAVYGWQLNTYKKKIKESIERGMMDAEYVDTMRTKRAFVVDLDMIFPYAGDRKNLIILRAKSGLKWLRPLRTPEPEARALYKITQDFRKSQHKWLKEISLDELMDYVMNNNAAFNTVDWINSKIKENPKIEYEMTKGLGSMRARSILEDIYDDFWKSSITERSPKYRLGTVAWLAFREIVPSYDPIISGQVLRRLGYDAFREDAHKGKSGVIFSGEPTQTGFLHPKAFKQVEVIPNGSRAAFGRYWVYEEDFDRIRKALSKV
jgi:hypothetical protein